MSLRRLVLSLAALAVVVSGLAACASSGAAKEVTVFHGAPTATVDLVTDGAATPGDVRVFSAQLTDASGAAIGNLRGTLTTTEVAASGDEIRSAYLICSFAKPEDQLVIGGESSYPKDATTIAPGTAVIRPVIGGSGIYAGARGWAETFHNADGSWRHVFHLLP